MAYTGASRPSPDPAQGQGATYLFETWVEKGRGPAHPAGIETSREETGTTWETWGGFCTVLGRQGLKREERHLT